MHGHAGHPAFGIPECIFDQSYKDNSTFDLSQANGPEMTLLILFEAYPYVLDMPDGAQRLVDERNKLLHGRRG